MNGTLVALAFVLLFVLLFMGVPIGTSLGIPVAILVAATQITSFEYIAQFLYTKIADFTMLSLPFFLLAGDIMDGGGLSKRMVAVANSLIGNVTGALGAVTVIACMFFGAVSGSAPATVAAIGTIMIPQMVYDGYDKGYAVGLVCVAGGLGIIVPPSFPMVLYGVTNGVSIGDMFLAGWGPSFVVGGVLIFINWLICKKRGYKSPIPKETSLKLFVKSVWEGKWALLMPIIILGGIYSGIFTATEAAVVASVYGIVIGLFVHRELKLEKLWAIFRDNAAFIAGTMFVMAPSKATGQVFAYLNITKIIANLMFSISTNPYIVLCMIFVIMFIVGMFVQTTPAIVILAPTLLAVVTQVGIDPIHFGIIMTLALAIAFVTPPVALNLFVGSSMTGLSIDKIVKAFMPFLIGLIVAFFIVSFVPAISLGVLGDWSLTFG